MIESPSIFVREQDRLAPVKDHLNSIKDPTVLAIDPGNPVKDPGAPVTTDKIATADPGNATSGGMPEHMAVVWKLRIQLTKIIKYPVAI